MKPFGYVQPRTVAKACALLRDYEGRVQLKAGGTDLLGVLKDRLLPGYPEVLIDLTRLSGLGRLRKEAGAVSIGALVKLSTLAASPSIRRQFPALAEAARSVATPQIRNLGTLGGNLCQEVRCWYYRYPAHVGGPLGCLRKGNGPCLAVRGDNRFHAVVGARKCFAVCPSDTAVALAALEAEVTVASPGGTRAVPVADLYTSLGTVLEPHEIVTEVRIPTLPPGVHQAFRKFSVREPVDFAVVSAAAVVALEQGICKDVRVVLGGVAPGPLRASAAEGRLRGSPLDEAAVTAAAEAVLADARPLSGNGYKIEIARALVRRVLGFPSSGSEPRLTDP